tara:strand:- start:403 stop:561 length:159 start_codon:yes stop_codon:yes gene_type:complete
MPSSKKCSAKFPAGSKAYKDCVGYKDSNKTTQGWGGTKAKYKKESSTTMVDW